MIPAEALPVPHLLDGEGQTQIDFAFLVADDSARSSRSGAQLFSFSETVGHSFPFGGGCKHVSSENDLVARSRSVSARGGVLVTGRSTPGRAGGPERRDRLRRRAGDYR